MPRKAASISSSSSAGSLQRKARKHKDAKKAKKQKKQARRAERAKAWEYERGEAARLTKQLESVSAGILAELRNLFEKIDEGDTVHIDGLEDQRVRKKLRHLLQSLRLQPVEGHGFRSPSKKVSFLAVFETCIEAAMPAAAAAPPAPLSSGGNVPSPELPGDEHPNQLLGDEHPDEALAPQPRRIGPLLPSPGVGQQGGTAGAGSEEEEELGDEANAGPRLEGSERQGVDLDDFAERRKREEWMSVCPAALEGLFGLGGGERAKAAGSRPVNEEEAKEFERLLAKRGAPLLKRHRDGEFSKDCGQKQPRRPTDLWGMTESEQARAKAGSADAAPGENRRAFDPERDLKSRKAVSADEFAKLVQNSGAELSGRFGRSVVASSFL